MARARARISPPSCSSRITGTRLVHVPYSGGGPAAIGVMGNNVQMLFGGILPVLGLVRGGQLKAIALAADRRSPLLPDVPTFNESGLDFRTGPWFGLLAPAKTPDAIIATLHKETAEILREPAVRDRIAEQGAEVVGNTPGRIPRLHQGRDGAACGGDPQCEDAARLRGIVMADKKLTGRIAADRIRMQSTPKPPPGAVERFLALGECTSLISDVMDELGIPEGAIGASMLKPTLPGKLICGPALTVRNITQRADPFAAAQNNVNGMAEFEAHNLAEDGDVLVISGVAGMSNMGGISALTGQRQGERGAIVMGGVRDVRAFALDRLSGLGERDHAGHRQVAARDRRDQRRDPDGRRARQCRAIWWWPTTPAWCSSRATRSWRCWSLREKEEGRGHPHRRDLERRPGAGVLRQGERGWLLGRLDVRGLADLVPFLDLGADEGGEVGGLARDRLGAFAGEAPPRLGIGEHRRGLSLQPIDDRLRRPGRREQAEPVQHLVVLDAGLRHRRHIRQRRRALERGDRERAKLAGIDMRLGRGARSTSST